MTAAYPVEGDERREGRPILLVEDNPDDELLTLRALSRAHVQNPVVVARDGPQALEYLGEGSPPAAGSKLPALVLLDLKLPKIDGLEVLKRLRDEPRTRPVPVIVLTSSSEERDLVETSGLGANGCIGKPVDSAELTDVVGQLGFSWLLLIEPARVPG